MSMETGQLVPGGAKEQTDVALNHLKNILRAAGSNLNNVLKTTVYIQDFNDFPVINEAYKNGYYLKKNIFFLKNLIIVIQFGTFFVFGLQHLRKIFQQERVFRLPNYHSVHL